MLYWQGMENELSPEQLAQVREWLNTVVPELHKVGLVGAFNVLLETPLGFLTAQLLWIGQPLLRGAIYNSLAQLLSTVEGTAWLREAFNQIAERDVQR